MYEDVAKAIDVDVMTPDLPGFGMADLLADEPSLDRYADVVASLLEQQGIGDIVLGGTSMGGYTAMAFCRRHGERVRGLALIDTKASADTPEAAQGRRDMADVMESANTIAPLHEKVLPKLLGVTTTHMRPDVVDLVAKRVDQVDPNAAAWAQRAMAARPASFDTLAQLNVPSVVIVGDEDVLTPPSEAELMTESLTDTELVVVPRAGHLTPLESPLEVTAALHELLDRLP
jgi:pimeloyl-ACP methyl ester carboxylesterase